MRSGHEEVGCTGYVIEGDDPKPGPRVMIPRGHGKRGRNGRVRGVREVGTCMTCDESCGDHETSQRVPSERTTDGVGTTRT